MTMIHFYNYRTVMNYEEVLSKCNDPEVGAAFLDALKQLFDRDLQLLVVNASEQSIAAKIAHYLQSHFSTMHVDVEYNRMGDAPKKVTWSEKLDEVFPDIIVHVRESKKNTLVVELKKDTNPETKEKDLKKLAAYRKELEYRNALFIRLGTKTHAGIVCECEWVSG